MKKLVKVEEVPGEGLVGLLGKNVLLFCLNYIYTGKLVGVNDTFCMLEDPRIVYSTGAFTTKSFEDAQALPFNQYIQLSAIESFGETDKK
jgi:hypothetical protein